MKDIAKKFKQTTTTCIKNHILNIKDKFQPPSPMYQDNFCFISFLLFLLQ